LDLKTEGTISAELTALAGIGSKNWYLSMDLLLDTGDSQSNEGGSVGWERNGRE
jgi:hypothetical protein